MGAIFFVFFMLGTLGTGLLLLLGGVIGSVLLGKKRPWSILSGVAAGVGGSLCLLPLGFFAFIFYTNVTPPPDFVETAIVIEEDGYQSTSFTADGVVYTVLALEPNYEVCQALGEPIFSYKTEGLLNGSQCGNYYAIQNDHGLTLVTDDYGNLFCPAAETAQVYACYGADEPEWHWLEWNEDGYYTSLGTLPKAVGDQVTAFIQSPAEGEQLQISQSVPDRTLRLQSSDGLIVWNYLDLAQEDGEFYAVSQWGDELYGIRLPVALNEVLP